MRKVFLSVISLGLLSLFVGCSNTVSSKSNQSSSSTITETAKTSLVTTTEIFSEASTQSTTISAVPATTENISSDYHAILDEYTVKNQSATPSLIQEFKNEASSNTGGIDVLAAISNNKVEKLAIISNQGIGKMADLHHSLSDDYSTYENWATKLTDFYTAESQKIIGEYLAYSSSQSNTAASAPSSTTPQDSIPAEAANPEPSAPSTTTVQSGENPNQVADRVGISVDELLRLNGMTPENYMLYPGQELRIK